MPDQALRRKQRSEEILRNERVPINERLPRIMNESEAMFRTAVDVALRAIVLCLVAMKGEDLLKVGVEEAQSEAQSVLAQFQVEPHFSAKEREFVFGSAPSHLIAVQFSWLYEALWALLWALNFTDRLGRPDSQCDAARAVSIIRGLGREAFIQRSKLRSPSELLDATDLIYRYHWAVTEFHQLRGQEPPADLNPGVVMERHYALNWLIGSGGNDWDSVDTST